MKIGISNPDAPNDIIYTAIGINNPDAPNDIIYTDPTEYDMNTLPSERPKGNSLLDSMEETWKTLLHKYEAGQKGNTDINPELIAGCCSGKNINKSECGDYSIGAQQCKDLFGTCSADDIKERDHPNVKQQYCHDSCKRDPSQCEAVKTNFCASHPDDEWCSCINLENNADYQNWATLYEEAYPNKTANKRLYLNQANYNSCIHGTNLKNVFLGIDDVTNENVGGITTTELEKKINDNSIAQLKKKYRKPFLYFLLFLIIIISYSLLMGEPDNNQAEKVEQISASN